MSLITLEAQLVQPARAVPDATLRITRRYIQVMRREAPALLPIFRSRLQAQILSTLRTIGNTVRTKLGSAEVDSAVDVPGLDDAAANEAVDDIGRITGVCLEICLKLRPEACQPFFESGVVANMGAEEAGEPISCSRVAGGFRDYFEDSPFRRLAAKPRA